MSEEPLTPFQEFIKTEEDLTNAINNINKRIRQHMAGEIDGLTISKADVMSKAVGLKTELLSAWTAYKTELQTLVS